ncbi:cystathionine gamma-synthase [Blastomyces dermatitidis ATCC 18188]|uniref:cystathionine gamma-synthase n=1 Tax=Ajellomyces dermatitidis (strain ATCC 18188 / CBS 674.68) TaxID=653446 RepID=F2TAJ7_AJEDA|nr:cystathionine gamma-synthase [Blastomyces dermatitidis ATCC 18188]
MFKQLPVGGSVPPETDHAVSVSLPTWRANVGYEEGEKWVTDAMESGYPRFFIHKSIQALVAEVVRRFGTPGEDSATLFPSRKTAERCYQFMASRLPAEEAQKVHIISLQPSKQKEPRADEGGVAKVDLNITSPLFCVLYPAAHRSVAKEVWQHTGDGISSRRSEFCLKALEDGYLIEESLQVQRDERTIQRPKKGPKRYQRNGSMGNISKDSTPSQPQTKPQKSEIPSSKEFDMFIEERFGRNLSTAHANNAKLAVRRRIAGSLTCDGELSEALQSASSDGRIAGLTEQHVFLYPTGMSAIFNSHRMLMAARSPMKSICFGFPYVDTLKILQKWGPGVQFYGHASSEELDDLQKRLESGERFLALFTEFPGNPLLMAPDLERIRNLATKYDFAVVVDESVGNFINVNVLPYADVVVSSLTKVFSGDSNVMGGSAVFNPHGQYYQKLKTVLEAEYEDNYWGEDAIFLERNSRDFVSRIERINAATEEITAQLKASPLIKDIFYPKYNPTRPFYDKCKNPNGGYGGLFSITFHSKEQAVAFYDSFEVMKGPSLGTNFTLSSPYVILAHYGELEWANSLGVPTELIRTSIGLEDPADLRARVERALAAAAQVSRES